MFFLKKKMYTNFKLSFAFLKFNLGVAETGRRMVVQQPTYAQHWSSIAVSMHLTGHPKSKKKKKKLNIFGNHLLFAICTHTNTCSLCFISFLTVFFQIHTSGARYFAFVGASVG